MQTLQIAMITLTLAIVAPPSVANSFALRNQLTDAPSPYLQQHAHDKVHWQTWSVETLTLAREQKKPILLSIGYYACHWCHVMQKESYQQDLVAQIINDAYIPIKVDRELAPGLDNAMLAYAKSLIGVAGWPLNIYLTADARPYDAHVYLNAQSLAARLDNNRIAKINVPSLSVSSSLPRQTSSDINNQSFALSVRSQLDELNGGFLGTRKFPQSPQLKAIADYLRLNPDPILKAWLENSLTQMINVGLYDIVNGGFFRYTVDSDWRTPHFEKMLVDNIQLWQLYRDMALAQPSTAWQSIADQTLKFMMTRLYDPKNAIFYTSLSALDNDGNEGGHYLWSKAQLAQLLTEAQLKQISDDWQLHYPPSFDLGYLPVWGDHSRPNHEREAIARKLQAARSAIDIGTDKKKLVSYNGLMLSALSQALRQQPNLKPIADHLARFISQSWQLGRLSQGAFINKPLAEADLEGYAFAAKGLLDYAIATGDADASELAIDLLNRSQELFVSDSGFIAQAATDTFTLPRQVAFTDNALTAATSVWIEASLSSRDRRLVKIAQQRLQQALPVMQDHPFEYASLWSLYWKWKDWIVLPLTRQ